MKHCITTILGIVLCLVQLMTRLMQAGQKHLEKVEKKIRQKINITENYTPGDEIDYMTGPDWQKYIDWINSIHEGKTMPYPGKPCASSCSFKKP